VRKGSRIAHGCMYDGHDRIPSRSMDDVYIARTMLVRLHIQRLCLLTCLLATATGDLKGSLTYLPTSKYTKSWSNLVVCVSLVKCLSLFFIFYTDCAQDIMIMIMIMIRYLGTNFRDTRCPSKPETKSKTRNSNSGVVIERREREREGERGREREREREKR